MAGWQDERRLAPRGVVSSYGDRVYGYLAPAQLLHSQADRARAGREVCRCRTKFPTKTRSSVGACSTGRSAMPTPKPPSVKRSAQPEQRPALNYLARCWSSAATIASRNRSATSRARSSSIPTTLVSRQPSDGLTKADARSRREHPKQAADQLVANSVIQDMAIFSSRGRYDRRLPPDARAAGDGDAGARRAIEKKVRGARQKLGKK